MPRPRNEALKIAQRRAKVAEMYLKGRFQWEIADSLGIDQATVSRDLKALQKEWKESAVRDFDEAKEQELARVDNLERTYWESWERSLKEKETTRTEQSTKDKGNNKDEGSTRAGILKEQRDGNPEFLKGVQWCINKRSEILWGVEMKKLEEIQKALQELKDRVRTFATPTANRNPPTQRDGDPPPGTAGE
jgi:DNA-binding transcriptional ArsR family regulator